MYRVLPAGVGLICYVFSLPTSSTLNTVPTVSIPNSPAPASDRRRNVYRFAAARDGFGALLAALARVRAAKGAPAPHVLLPSYIGWSAREGSGVFDPVAASGLSYSFYRVDDALHIDLASLEQELAACGRGQAVVLLIHYFGRPAETVESVCALAAAHDGLVVEDEAHSWLTGVMSGRTGRSGRASMFSLHKLLAVRDGGLLLVDTDLDLPLESAADAPPHDVLGHDLPGIARRRRENFAALQRAFAGLSNAMARDVEPLWTHWPADAVPQSFPVVFRRHDRDAIYHALNARGVGVVSLYHTLIEPLRHNRFAESYALSRRIMNLPVHQGLAPADMPAILEHLSDVLPTMPLRQ